MKNKKGITLIALIITIIVLLILAGVSISILTGENGVLTQAQESAEKTKKAKLQELYDLTASSAAMNLEGYTYTDRTGKTVYIPSGFEVSQVSREVGEMKNGKLLVENEVDEGLVIIDKYGDEFVWIPVEADGSNFTRKICSNYRIKSGVENGDDSNGGNSEIESLRDNFGDNKLLKGSKSGPEATDDKPDIELNTVKNAKGFFVSRYEIGIESNVERSGSLSYMETEWNSGNYSAIGTNKEEMRNKVPKLNSKQGMEPVRMITQLECLDLANEWKIGKDYQSGLMTGRTWDRMVSFICDDTSGVAFSVAIANSDSSSWGNYKNNLSTTYKKIFTSDSGSTNWQLRNDGNWSRKETEQTGDNVWNDRRYLFPTGEFVSSVGRDTRMKNVYDVAGNVWEWTTEESHRSGSEGNWKNRVIRGGSASNDGSDNPASRRDGGTSGTATAFWNFGFRCVLYVIPIEN